MRRAIPAPYVGGRRGGPGPGSDITGAEIEGLRDETVTAYTETLALSDLFVLGKIQSTAPDPSAGLWVDTSEEPVGDAPSAYRYHGTADIVIATNTSTTLDFGSESVASGWWDDALKAWTVPSDGRYSIQASVGWAGSTDGFRLLRIHMEGSSSRDLASDIRAAAATMTGTAVQQQMVSCLTSPILSAGDKVSAIVRQNAAGNINVKAGVGNTYFTIRKLSTS